MNRRLPDIRRHFGLALALTALCVAAGASAGVAAVPANPPAKSKLGGAAAPAVRPSGIRPLDAPRDVVQGLLRLGASLTDRRDFSTAEIAYWQILNRPNVATFDQCSALLGLAHMYRREDSLTKAAAIYARFVKDHPDDERVPDALLELGRTLRDMGAYHLAFNAFYDVINSTLKFPAHGLRHYEQLAHTAQFEIAQTHFDAGEYAEAGRYFLKVHNLDLAPSDKARAQFMAAYSEQLDGQLAVAVRTLRSFLDEWPNDPNAPEARYHLATLLRQLKQPQEALEVTLQLLKEVRADDRGDPRLWAYWQRRTGNEVANDFFQSGEIAEALAIYQGLSALSPAPAWRLPVTYQMALCYDRMGQIDRAKAAYQAVIDGVQAAPGAPAPAPELVDLANMATWRLAHLQWQDKTERTLATFFDAGPPPAPRVAKPAPGAGSSLPPPST
ncbi:MAG: tetratricopeptide repeat protein [Opitutaceae bacterium]